MNSASVRAGARRRTATFNDGPALFCDAFDIFGAVWEAGMGKTPLVWVREAIWKLFERECLVELFRGGDFVRSIVGRICCYRHWSVQPPQSATPLRFAVVGCK